MVLSPFNPSQIGLVCKPGWFLQVAPFQGMAICNSIPPTLIRYPFAAAIDYPQQMRCYYQDSNASVTFAWITQNTNNAS